MPLTMVVSVKSVLLSLEMCLNCLCIHILVLMLGTFYATLHLVSLYTHGLCHCLFQKSNKTFVKQVSSLQWWPECPLHWWLV